MGKQFLECRHKGPEHSLLAVERVTVTLWEGVLLSLSGDAKAEAYGDSNLTHVKDSKFVTSSQYYS